MALIGKIRENSWFLIAAIVLGMGGFLFMDMIGGSRGSSLMGTQNLVGKIEGEKVQIDQFQNRERAFYGGSTGDVYAQRENFWNFLVEETLLGKEGEAIGLNVGEEELRALFDGENDFISPTVRQEFSDPQTGRFDINLVRQYLDTDLSQQPQLEAYIRELKNRVAREKMADKLNNIVSKSMYTPTWMVESIFAENNVGVSFSYVTVPYTAIDDSEVTVSDDDIRNYIKDNAVAYTDDEETRSVTWVEFPVSATGEDSTEIEKRMQILVNQFKAIDDDSSFTTENYGFYSTEYVSQDQLSPVVADSLMTLDPGSVVGPYIDNGKSNGDPSYQGYGFYKAVKLIDRKVVPDSVDTRHILIRVENPAGNPAGVEGAVAQLDSIKMFIEQRDSTFERMAEKYGQDGTASTGGSVGMMGPKNLLPEYRDAVFYESDKGDLLIVTTNAGVHLIEVLEQKYTGTVGVRVAYVEEVIIPSDETQKDVYNEAFEFVRANRTFDALKQSALEAGLNTRSESGLKPNDYQIGAQNFDQVLQRMVSTGLGSGESARNIVKWAHDSNTKLDAVSPEVYDFDDPVEFFPEKYVVVAVTGKTAAGLADIEAVRDAVTPVIINEKKAALIADKINGKPLEDIASEYQVTIDSASNLRFNGRSDTPNSIFTTETAVLGSAFQLEQGQVSAPVEGVAGVYVLQMNQRPGVPEPTDLPSIRRQYNFRMTQGLNNVVGGNPVMNAIIEKSNVTDRRSRFF